MKIENGVQLAQLVFISTFNKCIVVTVQRVHIDVGELPMTYSSRPIDKTAIFCLAVKMNSASDQPEVLMCSFVVSA